jgi:hypothetical protein
MSEGVNFDETSGDIDDREDRRAEKKFRAIASVQTVGEQKWRAEPFDRLTSGKGARCRRPHSLCCGTRF